MAASSSSDRRSLALSPADLAGRPLVFRDATVLTMDDSHRVIRGADVLIAGERISAVGPGLDVPEGTAEIDPTRGSIPPGVIVPPPHPWPTARRRLPVHLTLPQHPLPPQLPHVPSFL